MRNKKLLNVIVFAVWIATILGIIWYGQSKLNEAHKLIEELEFVDSTNTYNKVYYEKEFKALKKENRELYDSLKQYKDKISYIIQFTHEKEYSSGVVSSKPNTVKKDTVHDTITVKEPLIAKTYEYLSEPNDTFQYNLNINSYTQPNWYSLKAKVKNKFTIVNKEDGDANHLTIQPNDGGTISDVTAWKRKDKRKFWDRLSFGPGLTFGYDPLNKQWGMVVGATASFDLK